jgi:hypothetical protein
MPTTSTTPAGDLYTAVIAVAVARRFVPYEGDALTAAWLDCERSYFRAGGTREGADDIEEAAFTAVARTYEAAR